MRFHVAVTAIAAVLAGLLAPTTLFAQATIGGDWRHDVDRFGEQVVKAGLAPGMAVAVSQGEWVLHTGGFGVADRDTGRRVSPDTVFYIASSSKALTATAIVLMADRGEIDLDAPITRYLPELELRDPLDPDSVTVQELLTMTDGIEQSGPLVFRTAFTGDFTPEILLELLTQYGPSEAGNRFNYRNLPYNILGLALDPDDGHGWKDVVAREIFKPLGMVSTTARPSDLDPERIALPHGIVPGEGWRRIRMNKTDENLHAAGGHFTSARDLIHFVAAHASHGRLEGGRVFPASPIASTHEAQVEQDRTFGPYERFAWGYGWDLARWEDRTIVQRFGAFSGYRSHMSFEPETGIGVVVLTNGGEIASPAADLVASYVYDRLLESEPPEDEYRRKLADLEALPDRYETQVAENLAERASRMAPLRHPLEHFAGVYESPKLGRIDFQVVAGGLEARAGVAGSRAEVYDAEENKLRVGIGSGVVVDFEFPEDGEPATALVIRGDRYERVERGQD